MQQSYQKAVDSLRDYERIYGKRVIKIFGAANHYILMNLGDGLAASKPFPVETNGKRVWNLSIMLAPKAAGPADVGSVFVDDKSLQVIGATDKKVIMLNVKACASDEAQVV